MTQWVVPIVVAMMSPIFVYLAAVRKLSGRINTTEASILWEEAGAMREEYKKRAEECETQLKALRNEISVVVARNTALRRENKKLRDALEASI